jgi:hypothetical protein
MDVAFADARRDEGGAAHCGAAEGHDALAGREPGDEPELAGAGDDAHLAAAEGLAGRLDVDDGDAGVVDHRRRRHDDAALDRPCLELDFDRLPDRERRRKGLELEKERASSGGGVDCRRNRDQLRREIRPVRYRRVRAGASAVR